MIQSNFGLDDLREIEETGSSSWSDASQDLLQLILKFLTPLNHLRLGSVCRSWRVYSAKRMSSSSSSSCSVSPFPHRLQRHQRRKYPTLQVLREENIQEILAPSVYFRILHPIFQRLACFVWSRSENRFPL